MAKTQSKASNKAAAKKPQPKKKEDDLAVKPKDSSLLDLDDCEYMISSCCDQN